MANVNAELIKLESLQNEYDTTLQQYQEAVNNYISSLNTNTNTFTALKGRTWWGTTALQEGNVDDQQQCEAMCAQSPQCSGATFNPVKHYCWTRTGEGSITVGQDDDYALVTEQKDLLSTMKYLNDQLLKLNGQIVSLQQGMSQQVLDLKKEQNESYGQLNQSYASLLEQKNEIDRQMNEYQTASEQMQSQSLFVNQKQLTRTAWLLGAICMVGLTGVFMMGKTTAPPVLIICFTLVLLYALSSTFGFLMWFVVVLIAIGIKYQSP